MKGFKKYSNKKIEVDGIKFDSKKEYKRYTELKLLEKAKLIKDLKLQPMFYFDTLKGDNNHKIYYKADFSYIDTKTNEYVVEDVKGFKTPIYNLKKALMRYFHNINIKEI